MELKEAIQQLKTLNEWRRFDGKIEDSPEMPNPKKTGIAIDKVVSEFENLFISGVSNRREMLIDFCKWIFSERKDVTIKMIKDDVETYLGN